MIFATCLSRYFSHRDIPTCCAGFLPIKHALSPSALFPVLDPDLKGESSGHKRRNSRSPRSWNEKVDK
jgi:hypothetical protein